MKDADERERRSEACNYVEDQNGSRKVVIGSARTPGWSTRTTASKSQRSSPENIFPNKSSQCGVADLICVIGGLLRASLL